jgi:hypothetical protein
MGQVQFAKWPRLRRLLLCRHRRLGTHEPGGRISGKKRRVELLLTRLVELPIVRPPFGNSIDFLEPIPSKFLIFFKVHPRPVLSTSVLRSTTGKCCRYSPAVNLRPFQKEVQK